MSANTPDNKRKLQKCQYVTWLLEMHNECGREGALHGGNASASCRII